MYYIAICDENEKFVSYIKMIIEKYKIKENMILYLDF